MEKVAVEDAIHMSLDEYIQKADIFDRNTISKSRFRSNGNQQSEWGDETSDVDMAESAKEYFQFTGDMPNPKSQQWRLMRPNVSSDRPSGMPPLVPICADPVQQSLRSRAAQNIANERKLINYGDLIDDCNGTIDVNDLEISVDTTPNESGGDDDEVVNVPNTATNGSVGEAGNRQQTNHFKRWNNWRLNKKNSSSNHNINTANGGVVMRPCKQFQSDRLSVHQRIDHTYLARKHGYAQQPVMVDMLKPPPIISSRVLQPISSTTLVAGLTSSMANATEETFVKHCIDAFPSVAKKLLDQIDAMHRAKQDNKYDLKVQKEISNLQNKPLMYMCPGAAVVSSDGPGIEVDPPKPHTTDVSMNQRFA